MSAAGPSARQEIEGGVCYFQGQLRPLAEANVSIATHALNYGTGCFEGIRAYWSEADGQLYVLKGREHFDRLVRSARILRIELGVGADELLDIAVRMLRENGFRQDVYVRPLAFKAARIIKVALTGVRDEVAMFAVPMGDYVATTGLRVTVSNWQRIADNIIPSRAKVTGAYVNAALASDGAAQDGYDEAIMLGEDGHVAEASSANLFMVRDGVLVTPPVTADILEGITRLVVKELAADLGLALEERTIDRTELYVADELFLCGTGVQVAPVVEVDRRPVGAGVPGPVTGRLQEAYFRAVRGQERRYAHWLTPVYPRG
jgi:branched-chain amino acid aminotransferase